MIDYGYTNGVIAVKEKSLLKEKVLRFAEMSAEDAFRALIESGFGAGAEAGSVYEFEKLIARDEEETDAFIKEYAPSSAIRAYLFAERDFHNAKAIFKAEYLSADVEKMLAPEGLLKVGDILFAIREGNYVALGKELGEAVKEAQALVESAKEKGVAPSGAEIGVIFETALHAHLTSVCRGNLFLKKMLAKKADMRNILTAFRAGDEETAQKLYFEGGSVSKKSLALLFSEDSEKREKAFKGTAYEAFAELCFEAERNGKPYSEEERVLASCEADYFYERRFELARSQPFLYYVFRRRAENENVRILFVCLLAGMKEADIKKRLTAI